MTTNVPQGFLSTNQPDLFFEDNAVGRMKKEVWESNDEQIDAILDDYGVPSPVEWGKPGSYIQTTTRWQVEANRKKNDVVFIPVGCTELHGQHLPSAADTLYVSAICEGVRRFTRWLQGLEEPRRPSLSQRYIGSMVSDFHRNLLRGGIFYYPGDLQDAQMPHGKMRLMFEAQALAFLAEQAGGYASDGVGDVLDVQPHSLHQRVPLFVGNRPLVEQAESFIREYDSEWLAAYRAYRDGGAG